MEQLASPTLSAGDVLDDAYHIGGLIGRGGMAVVYEGRPIDEEVSVAIKVMAVHLDQDRADLQRRFFNELLLATRVRHSRIVEIRDFGVAPTGCLYIVMERLFGHTVSQELRRAGPMDPTRAVHRLVEALEGIELAHARGVIHADIKPSNLFLCDPGTDREGVKILDFGVAQRLAGPRIAAGWGGTPRYSPPELMLGAEPHPAVDLYQVGVMLAEMLSAQLLVPGNDIESCLEIHANEIVLPPEIEGTTFAPLIRQAIHPNPQHRFETAATMRQALVDTLSAYLSRSMPTFHSSTRPPVERTAPLWTGASFHSGTQTSSPSAFARPDYRESPSRWSYDSVESVVRIEPLDPPPTGPTWILPIVFGVGMLAVVVLSLGTTIFLLVLLLE